MGDELGGRSGVHAGDILGDRYRVDGVIGGGGVGIILAVHDLALGEPRAAKLLGRAARSVPSTVERFFREARAMARLTSEHAVRVFDMGTFDDGAPYLIMERLEGLDLAAAVKRRGALPAHEVALYVLQACDAIGQAHASGIVHRDLKPQNLFLTRRADGSPCIKVLDFGFSKELTLSEAQRQLTLNNAVLGSPAYMAPEQLLSARSANARCDIWSLGVVLYQLCTGQLPFKSDQASEMVAQVMRATPPAPSTVRAGLPLALDGVVMRCLEKDPALRYPTVAALSAALAPFVPGHRPAPLASSPPPPKRRLPLLALAVGAAVLLVAGVAFALLRG